MCRPNNEVQIQMPVLSYSLSVHACHNFTFILKLSISLLIVHVLEGNLLKVNIVQGYCVFKTHYIENNDGSEQTD